MTTLPKSFVPDETDLIEQQLDESNDIYAKQAALFERTGQAGNMWEHERKIVQAELRERIRDQFAQRGEKVTDGRIEDLANAHPEYREFYRVGLAAKEEYHRIHQLRIEHYIRRRELEQRGMR